MLTDQFGQPLASPRQVTVLDAEPSFYDAPGDGLIIRKDQEITDHFLDDIRDAKQHSANRHEGEFMHVASVPTIVVEQWLREGFDIRDRNVTAADIVKKLKENSLDAFLVTNKRV
jgi:hypothetical protein